jgi:hypothetical protein
MLLCTRFLAAPAKLTVFCTGHRRRFGGLTKPRRFTVLKAAWNYRSAIVLATQPRAKPYAHFAN